VERSSQRIAVEAVQRCGGWPAGVSRLTDVEQEVPELVGQRERSSREAEGVRTELIEDAALDPASKLAIGEPDIDCLSSRERPALTCRNRRDAVQCCVHGAIEVDRCHSPSLDAPPKGSGRAIRPTDVLI